jgi:hypothetical protein
MLRLPPLLLVAAVTLGGAVLGAGCSKNIGDACTTNVECDINGTRFCDLSQPSGYCTVEGCDVDTCPGTSECILFYTPVGTEPCTYDPESPRADCAVDEICICDLTQSGTCTGTAHCASEDSERRWCMARCAHNSDCRPNYECRETGTNGAEPLPTLPDPAGVPQKFCVASGVGPDGIDPQMNNPNNN